MKWKSQRYSRIPHCDQREWGGFLRDVMIKFLFCFFKYALLSSSSLTRGNMVRTRHSRHSWKRVYESSQNEQPLHWSQCLTVGNSPAGGWKRTSWAQEEAKPGAAEGPKKGKQWISSSSPLCERRSLTTTDQKAFVQHLKENLSAGLLASTIFSWLMCSALGLPWEALRNSQVIIMTIYHIKGVQVTSSSEDGNTEMVQVSQKKRKCF